jgi:hypothetical protein
MPIVNLYEEEYRKCYTSGLTSGKRIISERLPGKKNIAQFWLLKQSP